MVSVENLYSLFLQHPVICTDTRKLTPGCLFFALKGESFDGNRFAATALAGGAAFAVVDDPGVVQPGDARFLLVDDVLHALQQLATRHRRQFDIPLIAIGGSNGKTTTKELVAAVLSSHYPCHYTKGNLNNHIGVPLTLLAMPPDTEVAVIEMGTNQPGDITLLCTIAEPTHGLLTNIGKEHLQGFGSLEGVKKAEGELFDFLARHKGCAFVNTAEQHLEEMAQVVEKCVFYAQANALTADDSTLDIQLVGEYPFVHAAFLSDEGERIIVESQLLGQHNFRNIMTAIALGIYFKVPAEKIKSAIEAYQPANNRSQLLKKGANTIFLDAYNANPSSMMAALDTLKSVPSQQKIAILGDMLELGDESLNEHQAILQYAAHCGLTQLVVVGPEFGRCNPGSYGALHFPDPATAKAWLDRQKPEQAFILIKASRGMQLEKLMMDNEG